MNYIVVFKENNKVKSFFFTFSDWGPKENWIIDNIILKHFNPDDGAVACKKTPLNYEDFSEDREMIEQSMLRVLYEKEENDMITKEQLIDVINRMEEAEQAIDAIEHLFGGFLYEKPPFETLGWFFDTIINTNFTDKGADIINWWCFENNFGEEHLQLMEDQKINNLDDLWEVVKDERK